MDSNEYGREKRLPGFIWFSKEHPTPLIELVGLLNARCTQQNRTCGQNQSIPRWRPERRTPIDCQPQIKMWNDLVTQVKSLVHNSDTEMAAGYLELYIHMWEAPKVRAEDI
jgi:hypothetical protein